MVYESLDSEAPIKQGDIFRRVPRVDLSLGTMVVVAENGGHRKVGWRDVIGANPAPSPVAAVLPVKAVDAIVITQNCDAVRGEYLSLCQIDDFLAAAGQADRPPKTPIKWQRLITKQSRTNPRFFYLAADPDMGFTHRMAVDFRVILRIPRCDLEKMRDLRVARLNTVATEHFRESLSQHFRRYPYDEWYPLTKEEFAAYAAKCPEQVKPYPWQQ